jgi:hypothetical protein
MQKIRILLCFSLLLLVLGCSTAKTSQNAAPDQGTSNAAGKPAQTTPPLFLVHYMPWYQTQEVSGYWGWHWKMDHFDPKLLDANGYPQIASHFMPLTGPYDSKDAHVLEYQALLMKMSGIDGVIVDWYGTSNHADYPVINQATGKLFEAIQKAGLSFAICYEDQTVKNLVEAHKLGEAEVYTQGQADLAYLETSWFKDNAYLKANDQPVLFIFGPQYFQNGPDWEILFEKLGKRPVLVTLDQHFVPAATATFPWPPMWSSQAGVLSLGALENYLDGFYQKANNYKYVVAGAFPGFQDIYQEAGVGSSYGYLDAQDGKTFELTLQKAIEQEPDVIQLITWNDYGEGTNIEPTVEYGYRYLEMVQGARTKSTGAKAVYSSEDLRLPLTLFQLRKKHSDWKIQAELDKAYEAMLAGETEKATEIMARYP